MTWTTVTRGWHWRSGDLEIVRNVRHSDGKTEFWVWRGGVTLTVASTLKQAKVEAEEYVNA